MVLTTIMVAFGTVVTVAYHWPTTFLTALDRPGDILITGTAFVTLRVTDTEKRTFGNVKLTGKPWVMVSVMMVLLRSTM